MDIDRLKQILDNIEMQTVARTSFPDDEGIKHITTKSILMSKEIIIKEFELLQKEKSEHKLSENPFKPRTTS